MRIDWMKDVKIFKSNPYFNIEIKNHKCHFMVNWDKHVFGSKLYPIGKRAEIFTPYETEQGEYRDVAELIENSNWQPSNGRCYTNAEILYKAFTTLGYDAKYYSGWMFPASTYPVHHAWVVVDGNVYDISVNIKIQELLYQQVKEGRDPYSKECVKEAKELSKNWKPISDNFTWGKAHMIYVGAESNPNSARLQYQKAVSDDISKHPSYSHMKKTGKFDMSRYQRIFDEV